MEKENLLVEKMGLLSCDRENVDGWYLYLDKRFTDIVMLKIVIKVARWKNRPCPDARINVCKNGP
jgi:hypothetical protein